MKLERRKQLEVLGNDVAVLEILFANKDGHDVVFPGKYMPDGKEFRISLKGVDRMTAELREKMVQLVRGQFDARENEQNAEKVREKDASKPADGRRDNDADDRRGSTAPAKGGREEREASLEEILRTRERYYTEKLERLDYELGQVVDDRNTVIRQLSEVQQCIRALQDVSQITSDELSTQKEKLPRRAGSTSDGQKASPKKRTSKSKKNSTQRRNSNEQT